METLEVYLGLKKWHRVGFSAPTSDGSQMLVTPAPLASKGIAFMCIHTYI